jgi:cobalt-zinc-cadmium efflux system protein
MDPSASEEKEVMKGKRFIISIHITCPMLVAEVLGGIFAGSLALLSDAAHVFLDVFALGLSYLALRLASRAPSARLTFGFRLIKIVATFLYGATLLAVAFEILREATSRFVNPVTVDVAPMLVIAAIGLAANLVVALLLRQHDQEDLNMRSAFIHVLGDGQILKEAIHILNESSRKGASVDAAASEIASIRGVLEVHDVHVLTIEPRYPALSAHFLFSDQALGATQRIMERIKDPMRGGFGVTHTTIQTQGEPPQ